MPRLYSEIVGGTKNMNAVRNILDLACPSQLEFTCLEAARHSFNAGLFARLDLKAKRSVRQSTFFAEDKSSCQSRGLQAFIWRSSSGNLTRGPSSTAACELNSSAYVTECELATTFVLRLLCSELGKVKLYRNSVGPRKSS